MGKVIVIEFVTVDGVVEDPDGSDGTPSGGWAFRFGPDAVAGDEFKLGSVLDTGVLVLGRSTWQLFARIWPNRSDDFAQTMNRIPKAVASRTSPDLSAWGNSSLLGGELVDGTVRLARTATSSSPAAPASCTRWRPPTRSTSTGSSCSDRPRRGHALLCRSRGPAAHIRRAIDDNDPRPLPAKPGRLVDTLTKTAMRSLLRSCGCGDGYAPGDLVFCLPTGDHGSRLAPVMRKPRSSDRGLFAPSVV